MKKTSSLVTINGAIGEGGGQMLRSSLTLSMITGKPFKIINIRSKRKKPGLMRQHLTAVNASAKICNAKVTGAEIGSTEVLFIPQKIQVANLNLTLVPLEAHR